MNPSQPMTRALAAARCRIIDLGSQLPPVTAITIGAASVDPRLPHLAASPPQIIIESTDPDGWADRLAAYGSQQIGRRTVALDGCEWRLTASDEPVPYLPAQPWPIVDQVDEYEGRHRLPEFAEPSVGRLIARVVGEGRLAA